MRRTVLLLATTALAMLLASGAASAAPAHDNFANPLTLTPALTEYGTDYGKPVYSSNFGATRETGEPAFGPYATTPDPGPYMTVWYKWTADADGRMSIYDSRGCGQYPELSLGIYTGDALDSLTRVTDTTRFCYGGVDFDAVKGVTYRIQVGSVYNDAYESGPFEFGWSFDRIEADTTAPRVTNTTPANKATGVKRNTSLTASFSEAMDRDTIGNATFKLYKVTSTGNTQVTNVTVGLSSNGLKATLDPFGASTTQLAKNTKYKAVVTTGAEDLAEPGNALDQSPSKAGNQKKAWTFTTGTS